MPPPEPIILLGAGLLLAAVLLSKTSSKWGVPSLLLFLLLGMAAGSEGLLGIEFGNFELARTVGIYALAFILFEGGLGTSWSDVRPVLGRGIVLATVGTLLSAVVLGSLAAALLRLDLLQGMLLGSIIASTDAAAVFSILRSQGVSLSNRLRSLLELESGSNDPMAVFLTVGFITLIQGSGGPIELVGLFALQMAVGAVAGWLGGRGAVALINRLNLEVTGLYPLITIAFVLMIYEGTTWLHGSGFLAVYVAGIVMAKQRFLHRESVLQFHESLAWLMQIAMFVLLGLLVYPSHLLSVVGPALLVAALLIFLARPVAVLVTMPWFKLPVRQLAYISWVGLRGAVPIVLATFPVVNDVAGAETIFNVVFFVVLTSVAVQGTTLSTAARQLGLAPEADEELATVESEHNNPDHVTEVEVGAGAAADGQRIVDLDLPEDVLFLLIRRGREHIQPTGSTTVHAGDRVVFRGDGDDLATVTRLLTEPSRE